MLKITWNGKFDAGHCLTGHPKCGVLHGHTWSVHVEISGVASPVSGMLIDFGTLKSIVARLDHRNLNDIFKKHNPTVENIAQFIHDEIAKLEKDEYSGTVETILVEVTEGAGGSASVWTGS